MSEPTERVIDEVLTRLDAVAEKIGEGADYFWPVLVRQQYVEATFALVFALVMLGLAFLIPAWARSINGRGNWGDGTGAPSGECVGFIVLLFGFLGCLGWFLTYVLHFGAFFNPEFYALQDLLAMLK